MKIKNFLNKAAAAILTGVILASMPAMGVYAADTSVTYAGRAEEFVFIPDTADLFDNFKDVVPGDTRSQKITVRNTSIKTVEILLRAEAVEPQFEAFLRDLTLSVTVEPNSSWYNASAADMGTTGMTANRSLGNFRRGADLDITVNLTVPITWSNQFNGGYGEVVWVFTVIEEDPFIPPPIIPPYYPPYTPPPVTPPPAVTTAPPVKETEIHYDIPKPVPETVAVPVTIPETAPATEPETIIIEEEPVPLGSAETEAPLPPDDVPPTGDRAELIVWCAAAVLLTLLLTVLLYYRKRYAGDDEKQSGK